MGRGASGVEQQNYQRSQEAQAAAQKKQAMSLEERKFDEEKVMHQATLEHWGIENLANAREADYRDREQLDKENEQDENVQKWAIENGAFIAPNIPNNGSPNNGPDLMKLMIRDPNRFNPPAGMGTHVENGDARSVFHSTRASVRQLIEPTPTQDHWHAPFRPRCSGFCVLRR